LELGHALVTPNRIDFEAIAEELERLAPGAPPLEVLEPVF
jgi:hypothetical protein